MNPEQHQRRIRALERYLADIRQEQHALHHSELKSIATGYHLTYATGKILARRVGLIIK